MVFLGAIYTNANRLPRFSAQLLPVFCAVFLYRYCVLRPNVLCALHQTCFHHFCFPVLPIFFCYLLFIIFFYFSFLPNFFSSFWFFFFSIALSKTSCSTGQVTISSLLYCRGLGLRSSYQLLLLHLVISLILLLLNFPFCTLVSTFLSSQRQTMVFPSLLSITVVVLDIRSSGVPAIVKKLLRHWFRLSMNVQHRNSGVFAFRLQRTCQAHRKRCASTLSEHFLMHGLLFHVSSRRGLTAGRFWCLVLEIHELGDTLVVSQAMRDLGALNHLPETGPLLVSYFELASQVLGGILSSSMKRWSTWRGFPIFPRGTFKKLCSQFAPGCFFRRRLPLPTSTGRDSKRNCWRLKMLRRFQDACCQRRVLWSSCGLSWQSR